MRKKGEELIGYPFARAGPEADGCISLLDRVSLTGKAEIYALEKQFGSDTISWSCAVWPVLAAEEKPAGLIIQVTDMTEATLFRQKVATMNEELLLANVRQHALMEEELRKANAILEVRVQERTEELAKSHQRLQQLAAQLILAQERERRRVASELHDSLLSELAAMKYIFEAKLMLLKRGQLLDTNEFDKVTDIMQKVMKDARGIMNNLRPSILDDMGLIPTIGWLIQEYQKTYGYIQICKQVEVLEKDIPELLKVVIFRLLQEALNNFARHGRGNLVELSLLKSGDTLHLRIQDNGQGFDMGKVQKGLGLESMQERVEISGGSYHMESAVGKGTTISASWPLGGEG
jgi:signal transduction histidine kinase